MSLESPLKKAKYLGSAHHGSGHWIAQRLTALAMIIFITLNLYLIITTNFPDNNYLILLKNPFNAILISLSLLFALYHATLGLKVIFEDYISCKCLRTAMVSVMYFVNIITAFALFFSIIVYHIKNL